SDRRSGALYPLLGALFKRDNLFFFSSRRRHTRFDCDWSSDVCSSDLAATNASRPSVVSGAFAPEDLEVMRARSDGRRGARCPVRSEERRVGKECGCGWSTGQDRKRERSWWGRMGWVNATYEYRRVGIV